MTSLTVGVAIITYNGLKYLTEQLDSILAQTRPVSHIVVSDDRSTDGTWEFLQAWSEGVKERVRVTLIRNETQLGLIANAEQAFSRVEADIVFTADQDDVWHTDKVALLAAVFEQRPEVMLVHSDAVLVDAQGRDMGKTLLGELALSPDERSAIRGGDAFLVYCRRNVVTGATAAFRRSLLDYARPLPHDFYHDAWLAFIAAAIGKVHLVEQPTIDYRQHGANLVGVRKRSALTRMRHLWWKIGGPHPLKQDTDHDVSWRSALHTRIASHPAVPSRYKTLAGEALDYARSRSAPPRNPVRRTAAVMRRALGGGYARFSYEPLADAVRDVLNK
jgi:glycosyltransferase involved in cell wall biosynthesis